MSYTEVRLQTNFTSLVVKSVFYDKIALNNYMKRNKKDGRINESN